MGPIDKKIEEISSRLIIPNEIDEMIAQERQRRSMAMDEIQREQKRIKSAQIHQQKFRAYFPDDGPLRRELYPRHIEFFDATSRHREVSFIAGNRCLTPWTPIQTGSSTRQILDILTEREFCIRSSDGGSRCNRKAYGVFLKGIEPAFRLLMDNGEVFDCSYKHRVLTSDGFVEVGQIVSRASGLHCWKKPGDLKANYGMGTRPYGLLPHGLQDIFPEQLPSLGGVLDLLRFRNSHVDGGGHISRYSHASQAFSRLSILDDPLRVAALCGKFSDPSENIASLWPTGLLRELHQFVSELAPSQQGQESLDQEDLRSWRNGFRDYSRIPEGLYSSVQTSQLSPSLDSLWTSGSEFLQSYDLGDVFVPSIAPLHGGNSIIAIVPIGLQPIIDFTVESTHVYETAGVIHHNCGKTDAGAFATAVHLTGMYPDWWTGKRFDKPIKAWACGNTNTTTRDIIQEKLLGRTKKLPGDTDDVVVGLGTGMIPGNKIISTRPRPGIPDAVEIVYVKHVSGGTSQLYLKSYEQGRKAFEGTAIEAVWGDEEIPEDVYTECLMRTMTCDGIVMTTFTPLQGLTPVVLKFLPGGKYPEGGKVPDSTRYVVMCDWESVPHLSEAAKKELLDSIPPYQREARTKGIPQLGSGQIYPIAEADIVVAPFTIPDNWRKCFGMDVGWNRTAAIWLAEDPHSKVWYAFSEHYIGRAEPAIQAEAIRGRGRIKGVIDPAAHGRSQVDGVKLLQAYRELGLDIVPANNAIESGLYTVWQMLSAGMLKFFNNLTNLLDEYRVYRRDEKGHIVKENDHLLDSLRYGIFSGRDRAESTVPNDQWRPRDENFRPGAYAQRWMN